MGSLQGQNVVVIGGSRGVGRAIVEAVLGEGANVLAVARGAASLSRLAAETPGVKTLAADAAQEAAPEQVLAAMRPDVLVICAGALAPAATLPALSWESFSANLGRRREGVVPILPGRAAKRVAPGRADRAHLQRRGPAQFSLDPFEAKRGGSPVQKSPHPSAE